MLLARLIYESFSFAFGSLRANKLRTFLSLLGITIGIFAIISVFTVIDSLEGYIRSSLNSLGNNMVYIQKWPWTPPEGETEYPWWRYLNRPVPEYEETEEILRRSKTTENAVYFFGFNQTVQFENSKAENTEILATTHDLISTWNLNIGTGRYFTESESNSGANMAILGDEISNRLFETINPVGKSIKIMGHKFLIVGVYEKQGQDMFGTSMDKRVHIPVRYAMNMIDVRNRDRGQTINVKAKPNADRDQFVAELEGIMRSIHRLKPMEENDFAINEVSAISTRFDAFFKVFNLAGWIIGGFSILVGGFGIANIMFVSVKERTKIIGIQKSLGAKKYFILLQFIFEAVVLSLVGGLLGLLLIFIGTVVLSSASSMTIYMNAGNVIMGLMISGIIGVMAGFLPALTASRLDPVEAINAV
ncbi:MAG: ABC transporter [Bacteroidetes bacterium GWF2_42_66]|nr:MAG: ABC transporter [Bacteroidetes bacterium GWA2_42_15]OFY03564.1 MAG: ABC transporter [Bacteroidetes bacterium GWE2_42_39]OFY45929.1 MAG: ABC transporter [Bacteroidetes bacterium GWF2_42_66]HBL75171.1 ABC transporter [Prolixibacteraceae bacterium]HCR89722.1 ABC transporter [Prolixibacteraceae bacterium]